MTDGGWKVQKVVNRKTAWVWAVTHPSSVLTAYAVISGRELRFNSKPALEMLKAGRIKKAKRSILESV